MLKMTCDELDVDWQGYAKDNFDLTYEHMQGDLTALKSFLEDYAAKIAHMTVTKYETVYLVNGRYILE